MLVLSRLFARPLDRVVARGPPAHSSRRTDQLSVTDHISYHPTAAWSERQGTGCASGHLREEAHVIAERPRLDLEKGAGVAGLPVLEGVLLDLVDES
jgi:hypothetical protein